MKYLTEQEVIDFFKKWVAPIKASDISITTKNIVIQVSFTSGCALTSYFFNALNILVDNSEYIIETGWKSFAITDTMRGTYTTLRISISRKTCDLREV